MQIQQSILRVLTVTLVSSFVLLTSQFAQAQWPMPDKEGSFQEYLARTSQFLDQNKVWLVSSNKLAEKEMVMPFEMKPAAGCDTNKIGVLLIHGLSDSPYSLRSMGRALAARCLWVRSVLLPGHGTQAADLIQVHRNEWRKTVHQGVANFAKETDQLFIAGYSTGGTLAIDYVAQAKAQEPIAGLILFSPLLKIRTNADWLTPLLGTFVTWLDNKASDDPAKYASIPVPAMSQTFHFATEVRRALKQSAITLPVFVAMSAEDYTVNSQTSLDYFHRSMTHPDARLWLYANDQVKVQDERVRVINSYDERLKITGFSHMSVHMDPQDPYYGQQGQYRVCQWYEGEQLALCKQDTSGWQGEKGDLLASKSEYGARLSWNPDFDNLVNEVSLYIKNIAQ